MAGDKNFEKMKASMGSQLEIHKKAVSVQCQQMVDSSLQKIRRVLKRCTYSSLENMNDIIVEILLRLPPKSLARFKCVSKKWNRYISHDSYFRNMYRDNGSVYIMLGIFNTSIGKIQQFVPTSYQGHMLKNGTSTFDEKLRFLGDHDPLHVVGACNGFLLCCLEHNYPRTYFICNPITKESLALPMPTETSHVVTIAFICQGNFATSLHYKVVRALHPENLDDAVNTITIQVLSSEEMHEWKEANLNCSSSFSFDYTGTPAVITEDDVVYWQAATVESCLLSCLWGALVYDLHNQHSLEMELILLPGQAATRYGEGFTIDYYSFGLTNGLVAYALFYYQKPEVRLEMWALAQNKKEWSMSYRHVYGATDPGMQLPIIACMEGIHPLDHHVLLLTLANGKKAMVQRSKPKYAINLACLLRPSAVLSIRLPSHRLSLWVKSVSVCYFYLSNLLLGFSV